MYVYVPSCLYVLYVHTKSPMWGPQDPNPGCVLLLTVSSLRCLSPSGEASLDGLLYAALKSKNTQLQDWITLQHSKR